MIPLETARVPPAEKSIAICNASPLQVRNTLSYLDWAHISIASVYFVIRLNGQPSWDIQTLEAAKQLEQQQIVFLLPRRTEQLRSSEQVEALLARFPKRVELPQPAGRPSLSRLRALMLVMRWIYGPVWKWRRLKHVVCGNPLEPVPFLAQLTETNACVIVDDGLATVSVAARRKKVQFARQHFDFFDVFRPPVAWKRSLAFYTIFDDLEFGLRDRLIRNRAFEGYEGDLVVEKNVVWILGTPAVEELGVPTGKYKQVVSTIVKHSTAVGFSVFYLPHRREKEHNLQALLSGVDMSLSRANMPVEERVISGSRYAEVVIGFGSTALETLGLITPSLCKLWSLWLKPASGTVAASSMKKVFERHLDHPRVEALRETQLETKFREVSQSN